MLFDDNKINQVFCIAACARVALKSGTNLNYTLTREENSIAFECLPQRRGLVKKARTLGDPVKWFRYAYNKSGLCNIKAEFNGQTARLVCFYDDGSAAFFEPEWIPAANYLYNIVYREISCDDPAAHRIRYCDTAGELCACAEKITALLHEIGLDKGSAYTRLMYAVNIIRPTANTEMLFRDIIKDEQQAAEIPLPKLAEDRYRLYASCYAACISEQDADCLCESADESGRAEELRSLFDELYSLIKMSMLYAVNES